MNIPGPLLQELEGVKGFDRVAFLHAHEQKPVTSVRLNAAKDIGLFAANERVPWCPSGVYLPERPVFTLDPAYHAGAYYVQEASSMFVDYMLRHLVPQPKGLRILDLCAAPGGKSTLLASWMDADSLLISNEVIRPRASILEENMTRWGYMNTWVTSNDPRDIGRLHGYFDVVVVDAPCSGSGLFRKDERALDEWSEANVQLCSERQHRILADVWPALKQGGILLYATCSYSPQEDEQVLDWLAETFEAETLPVPMPAEWGIMEVSSPTRSMTGYRFFPGRVRGEGFFIAALRKTEETETIRQAKYKPVADKQAQPQVARLLSAENAIAIPGREEACAINVRHEADWHLLQKAVYLRKTGITLGAPAGKDWLPAHDVALSIHANASLPHIDLSREQALRFLKREDMGITDIEKGWLLIKYNGLGLGWIKSLGNRVNNYLPKHWRIRMDITEE